MDAIRCPSISRSFLVIYVTGVAIAFITIAFGVVASAVIGVVVAGIFLFSLIIHIPPAIPVLLVTNRVSAGSRYGGPVLVPALILTRLQHEYIQWISAPDWREAIPRYHHLDKRIITAKRGRGSEGCRHQEVAPWPVTSIRYLG